MEKLLSVEVIASYPVVFNECMDCQIVWHDLEEMNPNHLHQVLSHLSSERSRELLKVALWTVEMLNQYGDAIHLRVIDAFSVEGVAKSSQYGIRSYPAIVVNRTRIYDADSLDEATKEIAGRLGIHPVESAS